MIEFDKNLYDYDDLIALFWIRSNGLLHYKWYAHESDAMRLDTDDFILSGFIQAVSSLGAIFFDNSYLNQIRFYGYRIFLDAFPWHDQLVLITRENILDDFASSLLKNMIHLYQEDVPRYSFEISADNDIEQEKITNHWKSILLEHGFSKEKLNFSSLLPTTKNLSQYPSDGDITIKNESISPNVSSNGDANMEKLNQHLRNKLDSYAILGKTMGHTLNNILASILGNINLTMMDLSPDSEHYENLHEAELMIGRAKDLSSQLMNLANPSQTVSPSQAADHSQAAFKDQTEPVNVPLDTPVSHIHDVSSSKPIHEDGSTSNNSVSNGKILILEDEDAVGDVEKKMLNRLGFEVDLVKTGEQAIEKVSQAQYQGEHYLLAIFDYMIKGGLGGIDTVKQVKLIHPNLKCIIASGFSEDPIFTDFQKYQFDAAVKKPFDISELNTVIHKIL